MELEKICEELDQVAVNYFQILEELTYRKQKLEDELREGFFSLSKARYSMGSRSVGSLQYNTTHLKALTSVQVLNVDDDKLACTFCALRQSPSKGPVSKNIRKEGSERDVATIQQEAASDQNQQQQMRRRKGNMKETERSLEERVEDIYINGEATEHIQDPLKWFGILVPSALRQGQASFIQAVDQCTEVASLQNKLMATLRRYKELQGLKCIKLNKQQSHGSAPGIANKDEGSNQQSQINS